MKKIKNLSEGAFLKLLFAFLSVCFLVAALCMPDRNEMFTGLWKIMTGTCKISTNYFAQGGMAATFLNMGLVCLISLLLFVVFKGTPNNVSTLAVILTIGFGSWGINPLNVLPTMLGVVIYGLVKKEKMGGLVNAMLFSTGIAPLITELLLRYPHAEIIGFNWPGLGIAMLVRARAVIVIADKIFFILLKFYRFRYGEDNNFVHLKQICFSSCYCHHKCVHLYDIQNQP